MANVAGSKDSARLRTGLSVLGWISLPSTSAAVATLIQGRTLVFWPSAAWALTFLAAAIGMLAFWAAIVVLRRKIGARDGFVAAGLPLLFVVDGLIVLAFLYLHDPTNHLMTRSLLPGDLIAMPDIEAFLLGKYVVVGAGWLLVALWRSGEEDIATEPRQGRRGFEPGAFVALLLILALFLRVAVLGVLEIEVPSDLRVNYVASLAMREGLNPYDNTVALQVAGREAIPYVGTETWTMVTNPPTAMPYFALFTFMPLSDARVAFLGVNVALLALSLLFIYRTVAPRRPWSWLALTGAAILAFEPILRTLRLGQVDIAILFLLAVAVWALSRRNNGFAGIAVGLAASFKLAPVLLGLYFLWRGNWRALGGLVAATGVMGVISLWFAGSGTWDYYLTKRFPDLLAGTGLWNNLSVPGLINRFTVGTELAGGYWGTLPAIPLASALGYVWIATVLLICARILGRRPNAPVMLEFGFATAAVLVVAGVAWPHYAAWLLPVLAYMLTIDSWTGPRRRQVMIGGLVGIGAGLLSIPYAQFDGMLGGLYDLSVINMSLGNLGLLLITAGLALAILQARSTRRDAKPGAAP